MQHHSYEEQLQALESGFEGGVSDIHKEVLLDIVATGQYSHPWALLSKLIEARIREVVAEFAGADRAAAPPAGQSSHALDRAKAALATVDDRTADLIMMLQNNFPTQAPFTLQRLCEILVRPHRVFSSTLKVMNAIERLVAVTTTLAPSPPEAWGAAVAEIDMTTFTAPDVPCGPAQPPYPMHIDYLRSAPANPGEPPRVYTIYSTKRTASLESDEARESEDSGIGRGRGGVVASAATSMPLGLALSAMSSRSMEGSSSVDNLLKDLDDLDDGRDDEEEQSSSTSNTTAGPLPTTAVVSGDEDVEDDEATGDGDEADVHFGSAGGAGSAEQPQLAAKTVSDVWLRIMSDAPIPVSSAPPAVEEEDI